MKTAELIDSLSKEAGTVKLQKPLMIFAKWLVFSGGYLAAMVLLFGLRGDIEIKLREQLFMAEIVFLLITALAVGFASVILSYPDSYQRKYIVYLPVLPLLAFIGIVCLEANGSINLSVNLEGEAGCFLCICLFALVPGIFLFRKLAANASTTPRIAGIMGASAAFCLGALTIRLTEKVDSMQHIILVHYAPMLVIAIFGMWVGRKWLKW